MRKTVLVVAGLLLLAGCGDQSVDRSEEPMSAVEPATAPTPDKDVVRLLSMGSQPERSRTSESEPRPSSAPEPKSAERTSKPGAETQIRHVPRHRVVDVVDGDTVTVSYRGSDVSVRVIGIDTPETVHPSEPVECGGPQASAAATRMLSGRKVRLIFDPSQGRTDSYGRTLAYLQAPRFGDFGRAMIRQGKAAEYTYAVAYARQGQYLSAQDKAQGDNRGIWNKCGGVDTPLDQEQPAQARPGRPGTSSSSSGAGCDPGYDPCVPPYPPDLDCSDVDGPIRVLGDDPHGFDADGDGTGCDS